MSHEAIFGEKGFELGDDVAVAAGKLEDVGVEEAGLRTADGGRGDGELARVEGGGEVAEAGLGAGTFIVGLPAGGVGAGDAGELGEGLVEATELVEGSGGGDADPGEIGGQGACGGEKGEGVGRAVVVDGREGAEEVHLGEGRGKGEGSGGFLLGELGMIPRGGGHGFAVVLPGFGRNGEDAGGDGVGGLVGVGLVKLIDADLGRVALGVGGGEGEQADERGGGGETGEHGLLTSRNILLPGRRQWLCDEGAMTFGCWFLVDGALH